MSTTCLSRANSAAAIAAAAMLVCGGCATSRSETDTRISHESLGTIGVAVLTNEPAWGLELPLNPSEGFGGAVTRGAFWWAKNGWNPGEGIIVVPFITVAGGIGGAAYGLYYQISRPGLGDSIREVEQFFTGRNFLDDLCDTIIRQGTQDGAPWRLSGRLCSADLEPRPLIPIRVQPTVHGPLELQEPHLTLFREQGIDTLLLLRPVTCGVFARTEFSRRVGLAATVHVSLMRISDGKNFAGFYVSHEGKRHSISKLAAHRAEGLRSVYQRCLGDLCTQIAQQFEAPVRP